MRIISLDTETTGTYRADRIIEIGIASNTRIYQNKKTLNFRVNPGIIISKGAQKIHGISNRKLRKKPKFKQIKHIIERIINRSEIILMYNKGFDIRFLKKEGVYIEGRVLDVGILAKEKGFKQYNNRMLTLKDLMKEIKISTKGLRLHTALGDAKATLRCYNRLME